MLLIKIRSKKNKLFSQDSVYIFFLLLNGIIFTILVSKNKLKNLSIKAILLIAIIFSITIGQRIIQSINNQPTCICAYDGFGYYMYLPSLIENKTLFITPEWVHEIQNEYCEGVDTPQLIPLSNDKYIDIYHMGLAYLELPSYYISHLIASNSNYKTDGFSKPYQIGFFINVLLFIFIGLFYLRKLLRLFFNDKMSALLILILYFGSNIYVTFTQQYDLTHLYLFALNSVFLYHLFKFIQVKKTNHLWYSAIIFGLTIAIRPTQALWGIIPFILLYKELGASFQFWKHIFLYPLFSLIWNLPQFAYWYIVGGELIILNLHTEEIIITDPHLIDFLFSYRKGWLLYSPIFALFFIGLVKVYKKQRPIFWATSVFTAIYIFTMSSWECWWYAASYSSRVMIDIYPLLIIFVGYFLINLNSKATKIISFIFILSCLTLNIIQSKQYAKNILHFANMSKEHYWYIFGRVSINNFSNERILMNRYDKNWMESIQSSDFYRFKTTTVFEHEKSITVLPDMLYEVISRIDILKAVPTDETEIKVQFMVQSSDSTKSAFLKSETYSTHNCYDWQSIEISKHRSQGEFSELEITFNLPEIRHQKDKLKLFIHNPENISIKIKDIKVIATSAIRIKN